MSREILHLLRFTAWETNKKIIKLLNNKEFISLVRRIDLRTLEEDIRRHRQSLMKELQLEWSQSTISNTLALNECLLSGKWSHCHPQKVQFDKATCCLLRSKITAQGRIIINCKADTAPLLLVNDVSHKMKLQKDIYTLELKNSGQLELVLLFFFKKNSQYTCSVSTFCKTRDSELLPSKP